MEVFFTSDTHFGHKNVLKFEREDGSPLREEFANIEEMNEELIKRHNAIVGVNDRVYHLGDVVFGKKNMPLLSRLNGKLTLIAGNHDHYDRGLASYVHYFDEILASKNITVGNNDRGIMTHIPVHESQLDTRFTFNLHGHLHDIELDDSRYLNMGVECWNYEPVNLTVVKETLERKGVI
jgi:calcineurin-like phosphoesterase family protein